MDVSGQNSRERERRINRKKNPFIFGMENSHYSIRNWEVELKRLQCANEKEERERESIRYFIKKGLTDDSLQISIVPNREVRYDTLRLLGLIWILDG